MENDKDGKQRYIEESISSNVNESEKKESKKEVTLDVYNGNASKIKDIMELFGTSKRSTFNILIKYGSSFLSHANLQDYEIEEMAGRETDMEVKLHITKSTEERIKNMDERHDASSALNIAAARFHSNMEIEKIKEKNNGK